MKIERRKVKADVSAVAMGDIAFNLLVFFVILARAQDDSHVEWEPAHAAKVDKIENPRASIVVDKDRAIWLNGQKVGGTALSDLLETVLGAAPAGQRTVLLKVDKAVQAVSFQPVIESISEAGGELAYILDKSGPTATAAK